MNGGRKGIMKNWTLDPQGFVSHYLVSGPKTVPFSAASGDANLLRFESGLRKEVARHEPVPDPEVKDGAGLSRLGLPWRFLGGRDTSLVNLSDFYSTMQRVAFDAATVLVSPRRQTLTAVLWSYAAVDVYCNGERIGSLEHPVYKPIQRREILLPLRQGRNHLYLACETLGVRDTRSVVGLQILRAGSPAEEIAITLPDEALAEEAASALDFLENAELTEERVLFSAPAPKGASWAVGRGYEPDHRKAHLPLRWQDLEGQREIPLEPGYAWVILQAPAGNGFVRRMLERTEQIRPKYDPPEVRAGGETEEAHLRRILERIAEIENFDRGEEFGFPICNLLARQYLGRPAEQDGQLFDSMLDLIERRVDCADFLVCGLIRYIRNYPVSPEREARIREVLTHWRYWMDMDGFDGMCFWSENHCLMFYTGAMLAGEMYPEAEFPLARRTGRELSAWGREKILSWLEDVESCGFEEFHSTVYMCVTLAALLNVIDYAEASISRRAAAVTDMMLMRLALHTFRGGIIAPQGRVYRGVLYPFSAGAMALMNLADPSQPWDLGEGWLSFYATSRYRFPKEMRAEMAREASLTYSSGNARIVLEKHRDWCLTSVQIPREPFSRWENIARRPDADPSSHAFVRSFNECFHGTTCFQPGVWGYQQHLWYAALDGEAAVFINHPGSTSEGGDLRPGYWHGNGVFPALKQEGNVLGLISRIPEEHPIHYLHLYLPECRFEEVRREGNWILMRKGKGFIGLWSSTPMVPWNGMNFRCEQRMWGRETACFCVCAGREIRDMDAFAEYARGWNPVWNPDGKTLRAGAFCLAWQEGRDDTQYL